MDNNINLKYDIDREFVKYVSDNLPELQTVVLSASILVPSGHTHSPPSGWRRHRGQQPMLAQRFFTGTVNSNI